MKKNKFKFAAIAVLAIAVATVWGAAGLFAQDPAAAAAAQPEPSPINGTLKIMNWLLIIIGLELGFIALVMVVKDPQNLSLGAIFANITGRTASQEEMDHAYDGITEIDNPVPAWLKAIFYGTIGWAFLYLVYYHVAGTGYTQLQEYEAEMKMYEANKPKVKLDPATLTVLTDQASLDKGKSVFTSICASCHGANGQGDTGPNLTDKFWLHGGTISEIYTTISKGVPGKAMMAWESQISDADRHAVASYIVSLQANPQKGRAPEGNLFEGDPNSLPGKTAAPADSALTDTVKVDSVPK